MPGFDNFDDDVFVDDQSFARRRLIGDDAKIGGAEGLIGVDAARFYFVLQRFRKRRTRHQRALDRRDIAPGGRSRIEQDFEEIRRAAVADRAVGLDQLELRFGIAGPGRNDRAAERACGGIENEAARRQMIAEGVQHHVAGPKTRGEQRPRAAPRICGRRFRLEDRARGGEQSAERSDRRVDEPAEWRVCLVKGRQFGLAEYRQLCERGKVLDRTEIDAL